MMWDPLGKKKKDSVLPLTLNATFNVSLSPFSGVETVMRLVVHKLFTIRMDLYTYIFI